MWIQEHFAVFISLLPTKVRCWLFVLLKSVNWGSPTTTQGGGNASQEWICDMTMVTLSQFRKRRMFFSDPTGKRKLVQQFNYFKTSNEKLKWGNTCRVLGEVHARSICWSEPKRQNICAYIAPSSRETIKPAWKLPCEIVMVTKDDQTDIFDERGEAIAGTQLNLYRWAKLLVSNVTSLLLRLPNCAP